MSLVVDRPRLVRARPATPAPLTVLCTAVVVCGLVARLWPRSALWLDEAQTIAIARRRSGRGVCRFVWTERALGHLAELGESSRHATRDSGFRPGATGRPGD